ncbi:hypothetical protein D9758_009474 [Tetrapyrgos nigripes]|uniref:Deacetylase sirtuin-type domain-containing protein n=1 Tax=Tetrapyrgos nigripes TaxID=182062 RepID=A0A8H5G136_9AGAR|nr:hypothetical protein D9758_009474 [Tetrapyrgos nigripes]
MTATDYVEFRAALESSKFIVILTGIGLSTMPASAVAYRARACANTWQRLDAEEVGNPDVFAEDPSLVWQFYHHCREQVLKARPTAAHRAIAQLSSRPEALKRIASNATLRLFTKNIDGLAGQAHPYDASPSSQPIELYGNIFRVKCTKCGMTEKNTDSPMCPALAGTEKCFAEPQKPVSVIEEKDLPRCKQCQALLRPDVVWFKEEIHHLERAANLISNNCDLLILVGTGLHVAPCSIFGELVRRRGGKIAVFNGQGAHADRDAHFRFQGPCGDTLVKALRMEGEV